MLDRFIDTTFGRVLAMYYAIRYVAKLRRLKRIKYVCTDCGSDDVSAPSWGCWSVVAQDWRYDYAPDITRGSCGGCGNTETTLRVVWADTEVMRNQGDVQCRANR